MYKCSNAEAVSHFVLCNALNWSCAHVGLHACTHCNCSEGGGIGMSRTLVLGLLASHAHAFNDHETPIDTTCKLRTVARQWNKRPWVPHNSQQYCSHDLPMCCLYVPPLLVSLWWYATSSSRPCTKRCIHAPNFAILAVISSMSSSSCASVDVLTNRCRDPINQGLFTTIY